MPGPVEVSRPVAAPVERVWQVIIDLDRAPDFISGIAKLERLGGPDDFGVGTRWRETRVMFGRSSTEEMEVIAVEDGRSYTTEAFNRGVRYETTMRVIPAGEQECTLSMHFDAEAGGLLNRTLGAVIGRLMLSSVRKVMQQDLDDIAVAAERG